MRRVYHMPKLADFGGNCGRCARLFHRVHTRTHNERERATAKGHDSSTRTLPNIPERCARSERARANADPPGLASRAPAPEPESPAGRLYGPRAGEDFLDVPIPYPVRPSVDAIE